MREWSGDGEAETPNSLASLVNVRSDEPEAGRPCRPTYGSMETTHTSCELPRQSSPKTGVSSSSIYGGAVFEDSLTYNSFADRLRSSSYDEGSSDGGSTRSYITLGSAVFHIFKGNVGSGVFLLPTYYKDTGYLLGAVSVAILGLVIVDCVIHLIRVKQRIDLPHVSTYPAVVYHVLGWWPMQFAQYSLIFTQFGTCIMYLQYASSLLAALCGIPKMYAVFVAVSVLTVTPLTMCSARVRVLDFSSMLATLCVVMVLAGTLSTEIQTLSVRGPAQDVVAVLPSVRYLLFIAGHTFALEGVGVVLPVENLLSPVSRPKFTRTLSLTLLSIILLYIVFGVVGYLAYGDGLHTSVVLALQPGWSTACYSALLALGLLFGYPIQFLPAIQLVDKAVDAKGERRVSYLLHAGTTMLFGILAVGIGSETLNIFAGFLGSFTGVHLMVSIPSLLVLYGGGTDARGNADGDAPTHVVDAQSPPRSLLHLRWYLYLIGSLLLGLGGTLSTYQAIFSVM